MIWGLKNHDQIVRVWLCRKPKRLRRGLWRRPAPVFIDPVFLHVVALVLNTRATTCKNISAKKSRAGRKNVIHCLEKTNHEDVIFTHPTTSPRPGVRVWLPDPNLVCVFQSSSVLCVRQVSVAAHLQTAAGLRPGGHPTECQRSPHSTSPPLWFWRLDARQRGSLP